MEAIRNGSHGLDDLTNYVFMITNTYAHVAYSNFGSGAQIVGLLGTPEFVENNSNRMVAFVRSMSGPAVEKPPQDNELLLINSFSYGLVCQNVPVVSVPMNLDVTNSAYTTNLEANLHELRMTFLWPLLPNSQPPKVFYGTGHQTYRALVAGRQVLDTNTMPGVNLYFFQSQSFTNAP
jgi:hypothetical protein